MVAPSWLLMGPRDHRRHQLAEQFRSRPTTPSSASTGEPIVQGNSSFCAAHPI
jgi:hypothetical protein